MSLKKQIYEAFEKGEKRIDEVGFFPSTWYQFFKFKFDPFKIEPIDPLKSKKDINLFINRTNELEEIAEYVGMTKKATHSFNLAIIGVEGIGKTSIIRVINTFAQEKGYQGIIFNVKKDEVTYPEDYEKAPVMGPPEEEFHYVIFDDLRPVERAKSYIQMFVGKPNLIISLWTPEQLIESVDFDREMYIYPLKYDKIKKMIFTRIKDADGEETISKEAIDLIAEISLGVPKLALKLARYTFELVFRKRKQIVEIEDVKEASSRFGYEINKDIKLTTKEKNIAKFLLKNREISPPELSEEMSLDRVIAWKYLERLHKKGVLEKEYHGKTTYFTLKEVVAVKMQLDLYPGSG